MHFKNNELVNFQHENKHNLQNEMHLTTLRTSLFIKEVSKVREIDRAVSFSSVLNYVAIKA